MRKISILILFILVLGSRALAGDVQFMFDVPRPPITPEIVSVWNATAEAGMSSFTVYADIRGGAYNEACCNGVCEHECAPACDWSACDANDFYSQLDPTLSTNPTCIPNTNDTSGGASALSCGGKSGNPMLYYYFNGDPATSGSIAMTYDASSGLFTADIPTTGYVLDDTVTYYVVATDNMGNVATQMPEPNVPACITLSSWGTNYETPALDNCSFMNAYEKCGGFISGTPTCASTYTTNDPAGDTCDASGPAVISEDDILGISFGAGDGIFCSKVKLAASPPNEGSSAGPIDSYIMTVYNPDISDPNPADTHVENSFAIVFAPEVADADPNLVRVLWDGECVTSPNTPDPLACKIIVGGAGEDRLKVASNTDTVTFIANNALPNGKSLISTSNNSTKAVVTTGHIELTGDVPFWTTDSSNATTVYRDNGNTTLTSAGAPYAPFLSTPAACQWPDATSFADGTCDRSVTQPAKNSCTFTVSPISDCAFSNGYNIYVSTTDDPLTASLAGNISTNLCGTNPFSYDITTLDGATTYFWVSAVSGSMEETAAGDRNSTHCTVEDWVAPSAPTALSCQSPVGTSGKCECSWDADTVTDPSISGFEMTRDSIPLINNISVSGEGTSFSFTDSASNLMLGSSYTYGVKTEDAGGNISSEVTSSCTPEDLRPPDKISSLITTLQTGLTYVNINWVPGENEDIEHYNVYGCFEEIPGVTCQGAGAYSKLNGSPISSGATLEFEDTTTVEGDTYCYWVEACDDCVTAGTCPSNAGSPNCSMFTSLKPYYKCITATAVSDTTAPLFPVTQTAAAVTTGGTCTIEWDRTCSDEAGAFTACDFPDADEIVGYKVMRAEASGDCSSTTIPDPSSATPTAFVPHGPGNPIYSDTGLTDGVTYCYKVYSFDATQNFSRNTPEPANASCTPMDIVVPEAPELYDMAYTDTSCSPAWGAVSDKDALTYSVYRCDDTIESCTAPSFSSITTGASNLYYDDFPVTTEQYYTYCITASDPATNESSLFSDASAAASANCMQCLPTNRPEPPSMIGAAEATTQPNYGFNAWWTSSPDDIGYGGYLVYLCTQTSSLVGCREQTGGSVYNGLHTEQSPFTVSEALLNATASYYIAVTYSDDSMVESFPAFSDTTVSIVPSMQPLANDITANGQVNVMDAGVLMLRMGCMNGNQCFNPFADLNEDELINLFDIVTMKSTYGQYVDGSFNDATNINPLVSLEISSDPSAYVDTPFLVEVIATFASDAIGGLDVFLDFNSEMLLITDAYGDPVTTVSDVTPEIYATIDRRTVATGTIDFGEISSPGITADNSPLTLFSFYAVSLATGTATISIANDVSVNRNTVLLSDDYITNILSSTSSAVISILPPPPDPPSDISMVNDGLGTDIDTATDTTSLSANWSESTDPENGIAAYWYSIGTTAGASDVVSWTSAGFATSTTEAGLSLSLGSSYFFSVKAESNTGLFSNPANSDGVTIPMPDPPSDISMVNDGLGADIDTATDTTSLSANWSESTDPENGIAAYWYSIGTTAGASDVVSWTSAGIATSTTENGLSLSLGSSYFFSVKAESNTGLFSNPANSDGLTIPLPTPPSDISTVNDGTGSDIDLATDTASLAANWSESTDAEDGINAYWIAIGTTAGATDVVDWKSAGIATSTIETGLTLTDGSTYYFSVKAENSVGLFSNATNSDGVTIDITGPVPSFTSPADGSMTNTPSLSVTGTTEADSTVTVNGQPATVSGTSFSATVTLSSGSNTITAEATDTAGNSGSASISVTLDDTPPVATITSPADGDSVSETLSITGTATDDNISSYTLELGPGASPTSWMSIGSGTTAVSAANLGSFDFSNRVGAYTIKLTVEDSAGNSSTDSVTVTSTMNVSLTVQASQESWIMSSLPMTPDSETLALLSDTSKYLIYTWNPQNEDDPVYGKYETPTTFSAGMGMWIIPLQSLSDELSLGGLGVDTTSSFDYDLYSGWNQIGTPFSREFTWASVQIISGGQTYSMTDAVTAGIIESSPFYYDGAGWRQLTEMTNTNMIPGTGYFIYVTSSSDPTTLVYDPALRPVSGVAKIIRETASFKVKISARTSAAEDLDNILAMSGTASDDWDGTDLREPPDINGKYVSLFFPHESWGRQSGRYTNDIRDTWGFDTGCDAGNDVTTCKLWDFNVKTNDSGAQVSLEWGSLSDYSGLYEISLTHITSNTVVDMIANNSYSFTAGAGDSSETQFRVKVTKKGLAKITATHTIPGGWSLVSFPLDPEDTDAAAQLGDDSDAFTLYQLYDGQFHSIDDTGGVDIQAGLGYWMYVDTDTQIDVEGVPTDPMLPVEVPVFTGWNIVGNPYDTKIAWDDNISVLCDGVSNSLSSAIANNWISRLFLFEDGDYEPVQKAGQLDTWTGYFIRSNEDCVLHFEQ